MLSTSGNRFKTVGTHSRVIPHEAEECPDCAKLSKEKVATLKNLKYKTFCGFCVFLNTWCWECNIRKEATAHCRIPFFVLCTVASSSYAKFMSWLTNFSENVCFEKFLYFEQLVKQRSENQFSLYFYIPKSQPWIFPHSTLETIQHTTSCVFGSLLTQTSIVFHCTSNTCVCVYGILFHTVYFCHAY